MQRNRGGRLYTGAAAVLWRYEHQPEAGSCAFDPTLLLEAYFVES
jgi:hypothetical protein